MREAKEPTVRIRPRFRETIPGTTILVTLRVALLEEDKESVQLPRAGQGEDIHVDLDDVDHVLVGQLLEERRLLVALSDIVD
jgi:hypothetical protein